MSETQRIRDQLRAAYDGSPWYGDSVTEILDGVNAADAAGHPVADAHSIWELVLHMAHWRRVALEALAGKSIAHYGADVAGDWRTPEDTSEKAWEEACGAVKALIQRFPARLFGVDLQWLVYAAGFRELARIIKRIHPWNGDRRI